MTVPIKHNPSKIELFDVDGVIIEHQWDDYSNHRIVVNVGKADKPLPLASQWVPWRKFAKLEYKGSVYYGVGDCWYNEFHAAVWAQVRGKCI